MTKRIRAALIACLGGLTALLLLLGMVWLSPLRAGAEEAPPSNVSHATVAVHDPSIVLAYEDASGKTYAEKGAGRTKVYYVFGTNLGTVKSYDLVNWESVSLNLHDFSTFYKTLGDVAKYSGLTASTLEGNLWAPDVVWNPVMGKWTMYLSVNGASYNSSIVLLTADSLNGPWAYVAPVVFSGMGWGKNDTSLTDYYSVTGDTSVPSRYVQNTRGGTSTGTMLYGMNAIDACILFDGDELYMTYGSWFGGIYMLKLDPATGLRGATYTDNIVYSAEDTQGTVNSNAKYTVYTDRYMGIHIAGGHGVTGEGSYIQKIDNYFYLFMSYGGYAPDGGYNMRVFRSETITGFADNDYSNAANFKGYVDVGGTTAMVLDSNTSSRGQEDATGGRVMSGYTWSWWDFSYVAQGHNSAFVDDDGRAYLVYHNKYMDGTVFHVMKVHELLVNSDGWLVTAPFEATLGSDKIATGLTAEDLSGGWGYLFMTRNSGRYGNPVRDTRITLTAEAGENGLITGTSTEVNTNTQPRAATFTYDPKTGEFVWNANYAHRGYVLWQNLEGTNIRTLAFTVVSSDAKSYSKYTYWGYKYPDTAVAAAYAAGSVAIPDKLGTGAALPSPTEEFWGVSVSFKEEGGDIVTLVNGQETARYPYTVSESVAEYSALGAGQRLIPVSYTKIDELSISFSYSGYTSDWTTVLAGEKVKVNLSVLMYNNNGTWLDIFESAATSSNGGAWDSFLGSGRATVTFSSNGSVRFYKDGTLKLTYGASTAFNNSSVKVETMCAALLSEMQAGTLTAGVGMKNVVITATGETASSGLNIKVSEGITVYEKLAGGTSNTNLPAIAEAASGLSFSFTASGAASDWEATALQTGAMKITLPNLDAWGATGTLALTNKFPEAANFKNGGKWDAFLNTTSFVTVSVSESGIRYYKDGVLLVEYAATDKMNYNNAGASNKVTVGDFIAAFLASVAQNGCTVAPSAVTATDLVVTSALDDARAAALFTAYKNITDCTTDGHDWSEWQVTREATRLVSGVSIRTCAVCGAVERKAAAYESDLGNVEQFKADVASVAEAKTAEEKYTAIRFSLESYARLTAEEKEEVKAEYDALESAIAAYNNMAERANSLSNDVTGFGVLAEFWLVLKGVLGL